MRGNLLLEHDLQKGGPTLHSEGSWQSFCHQSLAGQDLVHTMLRAMLTWISLYRASLHSPLGPTMEGSSILLTATMIFVTPSVLASCACSRVWPPRSKPASNSACATSQCRCKAMRMIYDQESWLCPAACAPAALEACLEVGLQRTHAMMLNHSPAQRTLSPQGAFDCPLLCVRSSLASCCAAISGCCSYVLACSGRQSGCAFSAAIFMAASKMRHRGRS